MKSVAWIVGFLLLPTALSNSNFPCNLHFIQFVWIYHVGCSDGSVQCTTSQGIPQPTGESCYFNRCIQGKWSNSLSEEGWSCVENTLVQSESCNNPPQEDQCSFSGIRCLADENALVDGICTSRYVECIDMVLSNPVLLPGKYFLYY